MTLPRPLLLLALLVPALVAAVRQEPASRAEPAPAPEWFLEGLRSQMRAGGRWVTSNEEYRSQGEPEAYGIQWEWGIGKQSLRGRLFGLDGEREIATYWEMLSIWHPGERKVLAYQFGADGTVGVGEMQPMGVGSTQLEQVFHSPDGTSREVRHEALDNEAGEHVTSSFDRAPDGTWKPRRTYAWTTGP